MTLDLTDPHHWEFLNMRDGADSTARAAEAWRDGSAILPYYWPIRAGDRKVPQKAKSVRRTKNALPLFDMVGV